MRKMRSAKTRAAAIVLAAALAAAGCLPGGKTADTANGTTQPPATQEATKGGAEKTTEETGAERPFKEDGTFPVCNETVELTILVPDNSGVEDFATNLQTKMLEEKGNFKLTITTLPSAEYKTKINLMVAGGEELPDIIMGGSGKTKFSDSEVYNYAQSGAIVPLTKYYENGYFLKEAITRTGVDYRPMITSPDGEIYGVPVYNQSISNEYPAKLYMYQEWLDKVGMEAPSTPEEMYDVLKAFKTQDPNGNGKADEIPMVSYKDSNYWFTYLMNPFIYAGTKEQNYLVVNDGKLSVSYNQEAYREGLRYMKKLVEEELLSPLSLTQDLASEKALLAQTPTVVGSFIQAGPSDIPADDIRRTQYAGVGPLTGADGNAYGTYVPSVANIAMMVTKDCKNPEAAFKLGDLMCSEEFSIHTRWGEKGVDWLVPEAGDVGLYDELGYPVMLKEVLPWGKMQGQHWAQTGPYIRQYAIAAGVVWGGNPLDTAPVIAKAQLLYTDHHPEEVVSKLIYTPEESEQVSEIMATLISYVHESRAAFITGGMDLDSQWDAYLKELETIGLSKFVEVAQAAYDRMYK